MGTVWDAPNKEVLGLDPPWVEGTGGSGGAAATAAGDESGLGSMTKDELLDYADDVGADANSSMTKAEIVKAIEAAEAE